MRLYAAIILIFFGTLKADILDFSTLKADFAQTIVNEQNSSIEYKGTLYIKKPDKILWEYSYPIKKFIYITQHNVTIYEPELYQAIIFKQKKELDPIKMFNESKTLTSTKRVSTYDGSEITIIHDKKNVKSLYFLDKIGNKNSIKFTSYESEKKIDDSIFIFKATEDIDIIRE